MTVADPGRAPVPPLRRPRSGRFHDRTGPGTGTDGVGDADGRPPGRPSGRDLEHNLNQHQPYIRILL